MNWDEKQDFIAWYEPSEKKGGLKPLTKKIHLEPIMSMSGEVLWIPEKDVLSGEFQCENCGAIFKEDLEVCEKCGYQGEIKTKELLTKEEVEAYTHLMEEMRK